MSPIDLIVTGEESIPEWTPQEIEEFDRILSELFGWDVPTDDQSIDHSE